MSFQSSGQIILVDRRGILTEYILKFSDYEVAMLIADSIEIKKKYQKESRIKKIMLVEEFQCLKSVINTDYEEILKYKYTQLKVESSLQRATLNYQERKYTYYNALSYWLDVFKSNTIIAVVMLGTNHGGLHDCVLNDVAVNYNIPVYNLEPDIYGKFFVFNHTNDKIIELGKNLNFDFEEIVNSPIPGSNNERAFVKICKKNLMNEKLSCDLMIKKIIKSIVEYFFGYMYLLKIGGFFNKIEFNIWGFKTEAKKVFSSKDSLINSLSYLSICSCPMEKTDKYIFYPLFFDPDAAGNAARHVLDSQLIVIQMLAKTLPKGWFLYVKEHPIYFNLNNNNLSYYYTNIETYRNIYFYDCIKEWDNVKIIDAQINSQELVKYSQGVAITQGTIGVDVIKQKKALLIFSDKSILRLCKEVFYIDSYPKCEEAMKKIFLGYRPLYADFSVIASKYLVNLDTDGYIKIIKSISNDIKEWNYNEKN